MKRNNLLVLRIMIVVFLNILGYMIVWAKERQSIYVIVVSHVVNILSTAYSFDDDICIFYCFQDKAVLDSCLSTCFFCKDSNKTLILTIEYMYKVPKLSYMV